ncbi:hypothetical protein BKA00_002896 [Actinomadura coerulea]|uniref:DUF397 domain-containing protein n=2 Tax=Actinomadura coerulea TaxID=46159 RepID=A0A7X0FYA0_9ACTN|nr:hypothetical protein [Actinomadura coerulea]
MTSVWRKSSYSGGATDEACVELAALPQGIGVRDSKNPHGEPLSMTGDAFGQLLRRIKEGALDQA